jgi:hypothetical protein
MINKSGKQDKTLWFVTSSSSSQTGIKRSKASLISMIEGVMGIIVTSSSPELILTLFI